MLLQCSYCLLALCFASANANEEPSTAEEGIMQARSPYLGAYLSLGGVPVWNWSAQKKALWEVYQGCWEGTVQVKTEFCKDATRLKVCCLESPIAFNATLSFATSKDSVPLIRQTRSAPAGQTFLQHEGSELYVAPHHISNNTNVVSHFATLDDSKNGAFMAFPEVFPGIRSPGFRFSSSGAPNRRTLYACSLLSLSEDGDTLVVADYRIPAATKTADGSGRTDVGYVYACPESVGPVSIPFDFASASPFLLECPGPSKNPRWKKKIAGWNQISRHMISTTLLMTFRRLPQESCLCNEEESCTRTGNITFAKDSTSKDGDDTDFSRTTVYTSIEGASVEVADGRSGEGVASGGINVAILVAGVTGGVTLMIFLLLGIFVLRAWCCLRRQTETGVHALDAEALPSPPTVERHMEHQEPAADSTGLSNWHSSEMFKNVDNFESALHYGRAEHWVLDDSSISHMEKGVRGKGRFGSVIRVKLHGTTDVALKTPLSDNTGKHVGVYLALMNEVRFFRRLRHPNIVLFHGIFVAEINGVPALSLVLEYMAGGDMEHFIRKKRKEVSGTQGCVQGLFVEEWKLLQDVARGLNYLHMQSPAILHRDLKPSNVLIEPVDPPKAKITDFGLSLAMSNGSVSVRAGTRLYMAPEVAAEMPYDMSADIYSFGCLCYFALSAKHPKKHDEVLSTLSFLSQQRSLPLQRSCSLAEVAVTCLRQEPEVRPSMADVYQALDEGDGRETAAPSSGHATHSTSSQQAGASAAQVVGHVLAL
eukprot:TRINITY_DN106426_c0_g1_i1.p1 TRINITY_DN106426_c0_g1~~TRINITY_DN106426_c0_g1_i1.p1  ORF type:complete len:764 (+),score=71.94 TRINITY_DN106426_c0_g1_i1:41-2332(+)